MSGGVVYLVPRLQNRLCFIPLKINIRDHGRNDDAVPRVKYGRAVSPGNDEIKLVAWGRQRPGRAREILNGKDERDRLSRDESGCRISDLVLQDQSGLEDGFFLVAAIVRSHYGKAQEYHRYQGFPSRHELRK